MKYKNYEAAVEFDDEIEMFHGTVVNTRDVITFYGKSVAELKREFKKSVDDYLDFCRERGEEPDRRAAASSDACRGCLPRGPGSPDRDAIRAP